MLCSHKEHALHSTNIFKAERAICLCQVCSLRANPQWPSSSGMPLLLALLLQRCCKALPPSAVRAHYHCQPSASPQSPKELTWSQQVASLIATGGELLLGMVKVELDRGQVEQGPDQQWPPSQHHILCVGLLTQRLSSLSQQNSLQRLQKAHWLACPLTWGKGTNVLLRCIQQLPRRMQQ